jgi:hypothetical protein
MLAARSAVGSGLSTLEKTQPKNGPRQKDAFICEQRVLGL